LFTRTARVLSVKGISIRLFPPLNDRGVIVISVVTDLISSENSISNSSSFFNSLGFSASPSQTAALDREVPWTTKDTKVQKKTILNISLAWGTPAASGRMAKMIGTAPRKPTQETKVLSLSVILEKGSRVAKTLMGRVNNI